MIYLPSGDCINLANVTWAENLTWRQTTDAGKVEWFRGIAVHFVGGSQLRLTGMDAEAVRSHLGMPA